MGVVRIPCESVGVSCEFRALSRPATPRERTSISTRSCVTSSGTSFVATWWSARSRGDGAASGGEPTVTAQHANSSRNGRSRCRPTGGQSSTKRKRTLRSRRFVTRFRVAAPMGTSYGGRTLCGASWPGMDAPPAWPPEESLDRLPNGRGPTRHWAAGARKRVAPFLSPLLTRPRGACAAGDRPCANWRHCCASRPTLKPAAPGSTTLSFSPANYRVVAMASRSSPRTLVTSTAGS
jgi:hypothetical protein